VVLVHVLLIARVAVQISLVDPQVIDANAAETDSEGVSASNSSNGDSAKQRPKASSAAAAAAADKEGDDDDDGDDDDENDSEEAKGTRMDMDNLKEGNFVLPEKLKQYYVIVPCKLRLVVLISFLKWKSFGHKNAKVLCLC
jgi:hypothetical protein